MLKGKFTIKNQKKLIIERQGRDTQDKKIKENAKPSKPNFLVLEEGFPLNGYGKHQSKEELPLGHQTKRKTILSAQKTESINAHKPFQLLQKHQPLIRPHTKKMKSCYFTASSVVEQHQLKSSQIKLKSIRVELLMKSLFEFLQNHYWREEGKCSELTMEYEHFSQFVCSLLEELLFPGQQRQEKIIGLNRIVQELKDALQFEHSQIVKRSIFLQRNVLAFQYNPQRYRDEEDNLLIEISKLTLDKQYLEKAVKQTKENLLLLSTECEKKQKILSCLKQQLQSLSVNKKKVEEEFLKTTGSLNEVQNRFFSIQEKSESIFNYVMKQQNSKIIKLVSEDYKQIQADIYEYAVYLQSNQLASSLDYQPRPFDSIEKQLIQEMKEVNRFLIQAESSTAEKSKAMRDFNLQVVDTFKKKDDEMTRLCDFKTKCIRKFVNQMKKWLSNWQLKQEYLVNLRKQFAADSSAIKQKMQALIQEEQLSQQPSATLANLSLEIKTIFHKIQQNYKMGNSFY